MLLRNTVLALLIVVGFLRRSDLSSLLARGSLQPALGDEQPTAGRGLRAPASQGGTARDRGLRQEGGQPGRAPPGGDRV